MTTLAHHRRHRSHVTIRSGARSFRFHTDRDTAADLVADWETRNEV